MSNSNFLQVVTVISLVLMGFKLLSEGFFLGKPRISGGKRKKTFVFKKKIFV